MESWSNVKNKYDAYIQWIEYSQLMNAREMTSRRGRTLIANWSDPVTTNELTRVTLKQIGDTQSLDFDQVNYFTCKIMQIVSICIALH